MNDCQERLRQLTVESFGTFVTDLTAHAWEDWERTVAPPSPGGTTEILLARGDERRLVQASWRHSEDALESETVRDLATLRLATDVDAVLLVTNVGVSEDARNDADAVGVELLDSGALCRLARRYDVSVPAPEAFDVDAAVERAAAYWPEGLRGRARSLASVVDELGEFEHEYTHDDRGATVTFLPVDGSEPAVRMRFAESSLRVFARTPGGEFATLVRLQAHQADQPTVSDLEPVLAAGIRRALDSLR
ncbi:MAG: restriction endonuclease [Haloferacaceae archaeon]